jgi:hypothetical protein
MRRSHLPLLFLTLLTSASLLAAKKDDTSAYLGHDGNLHYKTLPEGDHIADFSYAGYMAGGVALPQPPTIQTIKPTGADDTAAIQSALDELARTTVETHPGALLLAPGTFHLSAALYLRASGLVLRGSGTGGSGTTLQLTGPPHPAVIADTVKARAVDPTKETSEAPARTDDSTTLTDVYVPSGSTVITVQSAKDLHPGDTILIVRPITPAWLAFMGMDTLVRGGKPETWIKGVLTTERIIASIDDNALHLAVPLTDSYDPAYGGGASTRVFAIQRPSRLHQVGVEDLHIVAPELHINLGQPHYDGVAFHAVEDGWVRNLRIDETTNAVDIGADSRRITVEDVHYLQRVPIEGAAKPFVFSVAGTQVLVQRVSGTADNTWYYATQARTQGPNVILKAVFHGNGHIQPHQRWSTGLLIDNCEAPDGGIDLQSRGEMGSGHGWPIGWGVIWNSRAKSFVVQSPPGTANWSIGNQGPEDMDSMPVFDQQPKGPPLPQGIVESPNHPVSPKSLYLQQLSQRLGPQATRNIGN